MEAMKKQRAIYVERIENEEERTYSIKIHYPDDITMDEMKSTLQREIERCDMLCTLQARMWEKYKWYIKTLSASVAANILMLIVFYWR